MDTPILVTKLYAPQPGPKVVLRPRLLARLNEGLYRKVTLVSAPAGYGKTTLVGAWAAACERPVAWLSLDAEDNDPTRFLTYFIASLQTPANRQAPARKIGAGVLAALQSAQALPLESLLTALLNEIAALADSLILVLDDYHVIQTPAVDSALTFLVEHLPPQLHLVIATREDPHLPLARLRARDHLSELRAADLRFTLAETAGFCNDLMGLDLAAADIAALEDRTEGWIAGLQLAALSLEGRRDSAEFIRAFAGSHRFVLDYLVEEVLQRQSAEVRSFLLQTAILDRLSGPLCAAVTGRADSPALLAGLERGNLFVLPLDDQRQWYRYHHLFADVLQARLREEDPNQVAELQRRAGAWYEQNGFLAAAIRHAFAAADHAWAAGLVERAARALLLSRQDVTLLGWLEALPDAVVRTRPVLSVYYALALLSVDLAGAAARLGDAERLLAAMADRREHPQDPAGACVVTDEEGFRSLPGIIAIVRAYHAGALGDVCGSLQYARQARAVLPEDDYLWRGAAGALLGLAHWTSGDLEAAYRSFADGVASLRLTGDITQSISGAFILANIRTAQGRLCEAERIYAEALSLAAEQGELLPPPTADLYVGLAELCCERNDLEAAARHLACSRALDAHGWISENRHRRYVAEARLQEARQDLDGALDLLAEAERLYVRSPDPDVRPIATLKARVWLRQGRLADALAWAHQRGLAADDDLSYLREFELITLARLLIARYQSEQAEAALHAATGLLARLLPFAEAGGRLGSVIEILVLQALAHAAQGNESAGSAPLQRALTLAEPEGYVRIFVDEGRPVAELLTGIKDVKPRIKAYVGRLLAACQGQRVSRKSQGGSPQPLLEPLSEREREVLRLLRSELSGPEMARRLLVSLNTLRTHTKSIYRKLGVSNRRAAVNRAAELDLV